MPDCASSGSQTARPFSELTRSFSPKIPQASRAHPLLTITTTLWRRTTPALSAPRLHGRLGVYRLHRRARRGARSVLPVPPLCGWPMARGAARCSARFYACRALLLGVAGSASYHLGCMMHAVHLRLTMRRFTLLLASALVVVFGGAPCGVGHFAYVGFARSSLNKCLVLPWLSHLVAT